MILVNLNKFTNQPSVLRAYLIYEASIQQLHQPFEVCLATNQVRGILFWHFTSHGIIAHN